MKKIQGLFSELLDEPLSIYTLTISLSICLFIVLEASYPQLVVLATDVGFYWPENYYPLFATNDDKLFSISFVEWFGVFYGFFLPMLLIRAWEQFDTADREFDREADAIKVLHEDILLLDNQQFLSFKLLMVRKLHIYVRHVLGRYELEHLKENAELKKRGYEILQGIRVGYKELIYRGGGKRASQLEPVTTELLMRLNDIIDIRGDRISIFRQRLYESLRIIAIVTSILWLIPFYFLPFKVGLFGSLLKLGVTFLIIFILTIIDDLDNPFEGLWTINISSWEEICSDTKSSYYDLIKNKYAFQKKTKPIEKISNKKNTKRNFK